jgi:hypothetical protein
VIRTRFAELSQHSHKRRSLFPPFDISFLLVAVCLSISPLAAQDVQKAVTYSPDYHIDQETRWLINTEIGSYAGLGFKPPHIAIGMSIEKPVSRRFEVDSGVSYSPDRKYITNDGKSFEVSGDTIFWVSHYFGLYQDVTYNRLWTSQFDKRTLAPESGVVFRTLFAGVPTRMYLDYVIPTGRIDSNGIESNRLQGIQYNLIGRLGSIGRTTVRLGFTWQVYHYYDQGNPLCDGTFDGPVTCRRTGHVSGTSALNINFEFGRRSHDDDDLF